MTGKKLLYPFLRLVYKAEKKMLHAYELVVHTVGFLFGGGKSSVQCNGDVNAVHFPRAAARNLGYAIHYFFGGIGEGIQIHVH